MELCFDIWNLIAKNLDIKDTMHLLFVNKQLHLYVPLFFGCKSLEDYKNYAQIILFFEKIDPAIREYFSHVCTTQLKY